MTTNERILKAQLHDMRRQLNQAWMAIRFLSGGEEPQEVIDRVLALVDATAFSWAKDAGLSDWQDGIEEAQRILGIIR